MKYFVIMLMNYVLGRDGFSNNGNQLSKVLVDQGVPLSVWDSILLDEVLSVICIDALCKRLSLSRHTIIFQLENIAKTVVDSDDYVLDE